MTNESRPPRRRWWPKSLAGKAGILALFAGVTLVVLYLVALHYSSQRLAEAWKLSNDYGFSNDFVELLGPVVPPERNMTIPLDRATSIAAKFWMNELATRKIEPDDHLQDPAFLAAMDGLISDPQYEKALAEADRLTEYRSPVVVTESLFQIMLGYLQTRRDYIRAEQAIARRLADQGKREVAALRLVRASRLTRRWEDKEPFLIAALINIAIRSVAMEELNLILRHGGPMSAKVHDAIEAEMAECETILRVVPKIAQTEKIASTHDYDQFSPLGKTSLLKPLADNDKAFMIQHLHRWMKSAEKPLYEVKKELDEMDDELKHIVGDPLGRVMHLGAAMLLPAVNQARRAFDRIIAKSRCLRIVNAMARKGDFKAPMDSLGLPKTCLIDAFDGKQIRIKQTADGPIVYTVGDDLTDDGGKLETPGVRGQDFGIGPPNPATKR